MNVIVFGKISVLIVETSCGTHELYSIFEMKYYDCRDCLWNTGPFRLIIDNRQLIVFRRLL